MSTFIYTLQRKVQQLQNTLRSLQEQNSNLRRRARMLSEDAPPGPPPMPTTEQGVERPETLRTYGGLGHGAFVTRTTQTPGQSDNFYDEPLYSGYRIRGFIQGVDYPITNYTYVGGLLVPGNGIPPYISPEVLAEIIILNVMQNPDFALTNFPTYNAFLVAFLHTLNDVFTNQGNTNSLEQAGSIVISQEFQTWLKTGWRSANEAGIWLIHQNWPY